MARAMHGGSRIGSGRKKGSGLSGIIKNHVDDFMNELLKHHEVLDALKKDLRQMAIDEGYIYVIKNTKNGLIKVGVTQLNNPQKRLSLYGANDFVIELLFIDLVPNCYGLEFDLLSMFSDRRVRGDWFDITSDNVLSIIREINRRKFGKLY